MNRKPILPVKAPASEIPMRKICGPFRFQFVVPGPGIEMFEDPNGNVLIQGAGGASILDLVAGDNIDIQRTEGGKIVISAVDTAVDIAAGQNITIDIDPETGTAIINSIVGGPVSEHYKGVFDTPEDLIAFDTDPEQGDYGMIKQLVFSDGGDITWNGQYKYCFYINGVWKVVDQMLTFTDDVDLLQQFYSVGGSSPIIYLHEIARTGDFRSLRNVPIVSTPVATVEGNTVTVTCETEGAEIWYSTDGSMPHVNGTKYTGPITATGATTYRFVGIKNGLINSEEAVVSADYSLEAPTIDLDWHDGTVSMTNPNASGTIYYTTDGTEPTDQSTEYSDPFIITEATTFKLVVIDSGTPSPVTVQRYEKAQNVSRFNALNNMIIGVSAFDFTVPENGEARYEMYDTVPTYNSPSSVGRIEFPFYDETDNPRWYSVRVFMPGYVPSDVLKSLSVGMKKPTAPAITYNAETGLVTIGRVGETQSIQFSTTPRSNNCVIRYTLDGSEPTASSMVYSEPFQISSNVTVKAVLIAYAEHYSNVTTLAISLLQAPTASLDYLTGVVTMNNPNAEGTIYYTTDGSNPTISSTPYSEPFPITAATTFKMVVINGDISSEVATQTFEQAQAPRISFRGTNGNYADFSTGIYKVLMTNPNSRGFITYTTDGTDPDDESTGYHTDFDAQFFDGEVTYKARIFHVGMVPSAVTTAVNGADSVDGPTFSVNDGMVSIALAGNTTDVPLQTNLNVPEMGARIWYTTDGSTPSSQNGTLYTGPFTIPEGDYVVKAITELYSQYSSEVEMLLPQPEISMRRIYAELTLTAPGNLTIKYTADGSDPRENGITYPGDPVSMIQYYDNNDESVTVRAVTVIDTGSRVYYSEETTETYGVVQGVATPVVNVRDTSNLITAYLSAPQYATYIKELSSGYIIHSDMGHDAVQPEYNSQNPIKLIFFENSRQTMSYLPAYYIVDNIGWSEVDAPEITYNDTTMEATIQLVGNAAHLTLYDESTGEGVKVLYTTDGQEPTENNATIYDGGTISLQKGQILKAMLVVPAPGFPHQSIPAAYSAIVTQNVYVPESSLSDDDVANIVKNLTTGDIRYVLQSSFVRSALGSNYVEKDWMRQERNRDGITVLQRKTGIGAAKYATDNLYKIYCDTTANGGFTLTAGRWGATTTQTVEWVAGDSLDSIVAQLTSTWDATFAHVAGEDFIRLTTCQSSSSYDCTLADNTGGTVVDLSKQCRIGGVVQPETHRVWQGTDLHTLFPDAGIPAANTVQYAKSGLNLSYRCGGNLDQYMYYYEVSGGGHGGVDTYLAEDSLSARMSRVGFASCNGSSNPDAQALYDKYSGSWEAYMEASMVDGESTNANGIVDQTYSVADTVSPFLASVETVDFAGNWIPAFPIFYNAYQVVDDDFGHGIVGENHDISVYMNVDVMAQLNAGGCNISRTAYYQSVAQCDAYHSWFYNGGDGTVGFTYKGNGDLSARVLAYIRPS